MKHKLYSLFLTALLGIWGMQAWAQELSTTEIDGITYYEIGSAADLVAFADLVNEGEAGANAVLTADISLTEPWETTIGTTTLPYTGTFNGQGHKISGFEAESATDGGGFFGVTTGATIKDFSIDGMLSATAGTGAGVVGYPSNCTITGIHSSLEIDVPVADVHHVGGVVGSARGGNTITGCTFSGSITVAAGSTDNFGGVVAYIGGDNIYFCANYGDITFSDVDCAAGGVVGYLNNNNSVIQGCLNIGTIVCSETESTPKWGGAIVGRLRKHDLAKVKDNCWLSGSATGAGKDNDGKVNLTNAACITGAQLASGEVCYGLNGDQSVIGWYQTIGSDAQPTLDDTHAQVYMNGRLHCNGDIYEGAIFSNENAGTIQDDHDIVDGFCSYCGIFDEGYLTPNADDYYELSTAKQLVWFEKLVNGGKDSVNAVLTADIDFAGLTEDVSFVWTPIGSWVNNAAYRGHFDGQGHIIRNFNVTASQNYFGIFGVISEGAVIENFTIYGDVQNTSAISSAVKTTGVVGYARDTETTLRGIHSYLNIYNNVAGARPGGVLGSAVNGTTNIENCTYSGILSSDSGTGDTGGNYGGIVGYVNNNTLAILNITNCLFDGKVINTNSEPGGCTFGGFIGYSNSGIVTIKNCLSIGEVQSKVYGQFFGAVKQSKSAIINSYYTGDVVNGSASTVTIPAIETDLDKLASGEVAWKLNEETFIDVVWHQTLDESGYPVPYPGQAIVYQTTTGYDCISEDDPESVGSFISSVAENEKEFIEDDDLVACQALVDEYKNAIESWDDINNFDDFMAAYKASFELKESIKKSAESYKNYQAACKAAADYLAENNVEGTWATFLEAYLQDDETVEPSSDYPNGNYAYIMEKRNLDDEGIAAEIGFVNQMLENAIAGGITGGTEITRLLANTDFANGVEGWTTESDGIAIVTGGETSIMRLARGLGNGTFSMSQTLSEMPNGIYMVSANGMFRSGNEINSKFYAGQLYLNGIANYIMSPGDDVIAEEDAIPGENCLGEDGDAKYVDDIVSGYVPKSIGGCSYAFSAGRYLNFCAAEVTDGTLTVGIRSLGTGSDSDWLPFGGLHVYYLGTAEEANAKLAQVLDAFADRAQAIVDFEGSQYEDEFALYPFMDEGLKTQLTEAIADVWNAASGEEKMELIAKFSDLFAQVHASRRAYIAMLQAANNLTNLLDPLLETGMIDDEEYNAWLDKIYETQDHFTFGDVTTEQAIAITQELNIIDKMLPSVDGVYQISTAQQVKLFAMTVNTGRNNVKAVLTNDIDMSEIESYEPIGSTGYPFMGEFDGQGFKVTGFGRYDEELGYTLTLSGQGAGFFGYVNGAVIRNFSIEGTVEVIGGKYIGAIGQAVKSNISDVHSSLNIHVTASSVHHTGGVVGSTEGGSSSTITRCSYSGNMTVAAGSTDNFAGILGYSGGDEVTDCANYGTITFSDAGCAAGGILGYINNIVTIVQNCLNAGAVSCSVSDSPKYGGAIIGRIKNNWSSTGVVNNYWLAGSAYGPARKDDGTSPAAASAEGSTAEQLASGEVCYKLNGEQEEINWFQTLGEDAYPVLFSTHKRVWLDGETYTNTEPGAGIEGDLNGDEKVDIADAVAVLEVMARDGNDAEADLNGDGKVDIADFVAVLEIMAKQ